MNYIVELEPGVYLAPWEGDPGRTLSQGNARVFSSKQVAEKYAKVASMYRKFNWKILEKGNISHWFECLGLDQDDLSCDRRCKKEKE